MNKKLISLLLCLAMVFTACMLGGCGTTDTTTDDDTTAETVRSTQTISMWIVSENKLSAETEAAVEKAFNEVAESKYTTRVDLVFFTEDEYKAKVDAQFDKITGRPAGTPIKPTTTEETYIRDDDGVLVPEYPAVSEYQMDILLITNKEMLNEYVEAGHLKTLNDALTNTYKIIGRYIYDGILQNAKIGEDWYAVPNNQMIGEYTFLMVNRDLATKYYFDGSSFTSFGLNTPAAELIDLIAENEDTSVIAPMYGMADYPLVKYWSKKANGQSVLSTLYPTATTTCGTGFAPTVSNLFTADNYKSFMSEMFYCKENGYFMTNQETFGVGVMTGDYSLYEQYIEDYYVVPLAYPRLEEADVFSAMFAVTSYTDKVSEQRSMEIIKDLTCDTELRNILQYGVYDTHYTLTDDGAVRRLNQDYMMNLAYTGNVMMAYPEEGMPLDIWETAKKQNLASLLSGVYGADDALTTVDKEAWQQMSDASEAYFARLYACETIAEFEAYLEVASAEITASPYYAKLINTFNSGGFDKTSLAGALSQWWTETFASATT